MKPKQAPTLYELAEATHRKVRRLFTAERIEEGWPRRVAMVELKGPEGRLELSVEEAMQKMQKELS